MDDFVVDYFENYPIPDGIWDKNDTLKNITFLYAINMHINLYYTEL